MAGSTKTARSGVPGIAPPSPLLTCLAALAVFALACGVTLAIGLGWVEFASEALPATVGVIVLSAATVVVVSETLRRAPEQIGWALAAVCGLIWVFAAWNAVTGRVVLVGYGDAGFLAGRLEVEGGLFPRWLVGNAVLEWLYVGLWRSPFLAGLVPAGRVGTDLFVALTGATVMAGCATGVALAWARRAPLAVVLTTFAPIWVMLASGYDEIYPFVAGPFLVFLFRLFSRPLERLDGIEIGVWLGFLVILYVPFVPLALVAAGTLVCLVPRLAGRMLASMAATLAVGITICWPHGITHFFRALHMTLNLGETNTFFPRYLGHSAGPTSLFFDLGYALSLEHLQDLLSMWWWSGTIPVVVAALVAAAIPAARRGRLPGDPLDRRLWLALAIAAQQLHWAVFMVPKLGPRQDLDLFFGAYLTAVLLIGAWLDRRLRRDPARARVASFVTAAALGAAAASLVVLVVAGAPPIQ